MPKIAVPELSRRDFIATTGLCFGQVFLGLVKAQTRAVQAKQFVRDLPTFLSSLPKPKYSIGQRVIEPCTVNDDLSNDNGLTYQNKGVVIGMWWNNTAIGCYGSGLDYFYDGWVYVIHFVELPRELHIGEMMAPAAEEDLQPWY